MLETISNCLTSLDPQRMCRILGPIHNGRPLVKWNAEKKQTNKKSKKLNNGERHLEGKPNYFNSLTKKNE